MTNTTLEKLILSAKPAMDRANTCIEELLEELTVSISSQDFSYKSEYKAIIQDIKNYGIIYDSSEFLKSTICDNDKAKILEFDLKGKPRNLEYLNDWFQDNLKSHKIGNRSYVYMAWKMRPEEYMYVGKGKSGSRINLTTHGKLLESLKDATYFSMLFPNPGTAKIISNLEASLITLIKNRTDSLPKYNSRNETFSIQNLPCDTYRMDIYDLLERVALDLATC